MGIGTIIGSLVSIIVAVAIVGALAFGFIYLLRLWQNSGVGRGEQGGNGPAMRFVRALPLGQSERLVLVEVGDETLLVGVAAHGVTLLRSWPKTEAPMTGAEEDQRQASELAARFRGIPGFGDRGRRS